MKLAVKAGMILVAVNNEIVEGRWAIFKCAHEKLSPFVDFIDSSYNVCMNLMSVRLHTYYNIKLTTALSHNPYIHIHIYSTYIVHTYIHIHTYITFTYIHIYILN